MLGIAVLFFLGLWVVITLIAMRVGWKWGKHTATRFLGAFLGFMLTMGGFIVYWTIEYYQIQETVTHLCEKEGGITVYVTPEEWRKQIGEKEWKKLEPLTDEEIMTLNFEPRELEYNGLLYAYTKGIYRSGNLENTRIKQFSIYDASVSNTIIGRSIVVDIATHQILATGNSIHAGAGGFPNTLNGLKFWMSNLHKCHKNYHHDYYNLVKQYSYLGEKMNSKFIVDYAYLADASYADFSNSDITAEDAIIYADPESPTPKEFAELVTDNYTVKAHWKN